MENIKISVIVPVYNRLEHLRALIICLMKQTYQPLELIISDDGSTDIVEDYIEDLLKKVDFKIKHVIQKDLGFRKTRALNNAVKYSKGNILVFCDQDLSFGDDYLELIKENSNKNKFLHFRPINLSKSEKIDYLKEIENKTFNYNLFSNSLPLEYFNNVEKALRRDKWRRIFKSLKLKKRGIKLVGMSYSLYKETFIKINGYDEKYQGWGYEDDDFGNRLSALGIEGKEIKTSNLQVHLWHPFDPSKKKSNNEEYYYKRKKEILKMKNYFCQYGYNNSIDKDLIIMKELN